MRTSIWLVRHGQTVYNLERRYQSWSDSPLTSYGLRQASALGRRLRPIPFDVALISPVERTRATMARVLEGRPLVAQIEAPGWAETNHGRWEGLTYREVMARFPDEARARWAQGIHGRAQGGESLADVVARVEAAWAALLRFYPGGRVLVATHATPIQLLLCTTFGIQPANHWQWRVDLGSITCLDVYAGSTIVRMVNEVPRIGALNNEG